MISNYIISERDGKAILLVNNKSVVFIIPNFAIKEDILQQAVLQQEEFPLTSMAEASLLPSSLGRTTLQGEKQHFNPQKDPCKGHNRKNASFPF